MANHRRPSRVLCCFIVSLSFVIIVPTLWFKFVPRLPTEVTKRDPASIPDVQTGGPNRTIFFDATVISADILHATMIMEWSITEDTCITLSSEPHPNDCTTVNIFFDINLSPSDPRYDNGPYSNNITTDPIVIWNGNSSHNSLTFRTELVISTTDSFYLSAYPIDIYYVEIIAFAQDVSTNESVPLTLEESIGLITGIQTTTYISTISLQEVLNPVSPTWIEVRLQRSTMVILYCIIITFTFWMITLMICLIMIATVFFGFQQRNEIVVVPIGTVFAFTQLWASMPGAPEGFGDMLDFVGLLPCLALLSISAITMVGVYLFTNPDDPARKAFTWSEL
ncbi:hypothetical protein ARMGADRAFT_1168124 [Armillaria gallica]|uniref:Transmembrane protein n=1 Tax=Armillaria gallica TaxID=47427 RepID=A0A2H3CYN7_ARMGA|nr:hypothetical protein ARMGADRAFT_1168124 [Armillaria gallica]